MAHLAFALAFVALPVLAVIISRSLAWSAIALGAGIAVFGSAVSFADDLGHSWTWFQLEWMSLGAFGIPVIGLLILRRRRAVLTSVGLRHQVFAIGIPMLVCGGGVVLSRLLAAPGAGLFTAVGFLVQRTHAEDNAKWLDFTGQLVQGTPIHQAVPMGGPLQLVLVPVADGLAAVSQLALGGVNQVLVAANSVVYAEYALAALTALVLAPVAEQRFARHPKGSAVPIPGILIWAGVLVVAVGSLAVSGLGHLSFQYAMIVVGIWIATFLAGGDRRLRVLSAMAVIPAFLVWFPLAPLSLIVAGIGLVVGLASLRHRGGRRSIFLGSVWVAVMVMTSSALVSALRYMTDTQGSASATGLVDRLASSGRGIAASVEFALPRQLDLLSSQGGTESAGPILAALAAASIVGGVAFLRWSVGREPRAALMWRFGPAALIGAYAVALAVLGTWWAGSGPNYGALKTTFLATILLTAVTMPLALRMLGRSAVRSTLVQVSAVVALVYLLAVDGLLTRAVTYVSPTQWPSVNQEERGHWWPAEVQPSADQSIASLPIACAYRLDTTKAPSALPDGQAMYACTRIISGLSGADWEAAALVNWARREWFTNQAAWDPEYPTLITMPDWVRKKNFILLDYNKKVIGLESVDSFLQRFRPPWAQPGAQPGSE